MIHPVPWYYRNVINPWQTPKEIKLAVKFVQAMQMADPKHPPTDQIYWFGLFRTYDIDREWTR